MRGHIQKKGKNYYLILELDSDTRDRRRKTLSVRKELGLNRPAKWKEADALLTRKLRELQDGVFFESTTQTVGEYLKYWLENYGINLRQTTHESYKSFIDLHIVPEIGSIQLAKLKPTHLDKLYTKKLKEGRADGKPGGLSARSVRYIHTIIREALKHAVKRDLIFRNVAEKVDPPRQRKKEQKAWTAKQAQQFLQAVAEHQHYPLYLLALATGMRRGELLGLHWADVDLDRGIIVVRNSLVAIRKGAVLQENVKTQGSRRAIKISPNVTHVLRKHKALQEQARIVLGYDNKGLVFLSLAGTPISPRNLTRHFESVIEKEKLPKIPFHSLRHTNATMLAQANVHMKVISGRLGHSSISITDIYAHFVADMQDEASQKIDQVLNLDQKSSAKSSALIQNETHENTKKAPYVH